MRFASVSHDVCSPNRRHYEFLLAFYSPEWEKTLQYIGVFGLCQVMVLGSNKFSLCYKERERVSYICLY